MHSANKKLESKKSVIKLLEKDHRESKNNHEQKLKTISTDKQKKKSGGASASKTKRGKDEMKDLLKQSYMFVKQQNESLANKLRRKMRKIEEMKEIIRNLEGKVQEFEDVVHMLKREKMPKTSDESLKGSRKYEDMVKEAQEIAKISLEKYKRIEKEMEEQKIAYEADILELKKANEGLKQEISRIKTESFPNTASKKKSRSERKIVASEDLANEVRILKEKQRSWTIKEQELKRMLSQINQKINNFEVNCLLTQQKAKKYKFQLDHLQQKYDAKCRKSREANEKWHTIFKDFMKEAQAMGKDIQSVKKLFHDILKQHLNRFQA